MESEHGPIVSVNDEAKKHLARNVPVDFAGYCTQIAKRFESDSPSRSQRDRNNDRRLVVRRHTELRKICDHEDDLNNDELNEFSDRIFGIAIRYEALLTSVDRSIEPGKIHKRLTQVTAKMRNAIGFLEDETRDKIVCEMMGLDGIDELRKTLDAFETAPSLAAKVTIAEHSLKETLRVFLAMEKHFQYKGGVATAGTPAKYAFSYAVFALADVFERYDQRNRAATVSQKSTAAPDDDMEWSGLFSYSGGFLQFARAFFEIYNRNEFQDRVASGFDTAVRRAAQKRKKDPELHRLLEGDATAQDVLDFMVRLDAI